jgi:hypothetical protein
MTFIYCGSEEYYVMYFYLVMYLYSFPLCRYMQLQNYDVAKSCHIP